MSQSQHAKQSELQALKLQESALNALLQKCTKYRYKLHVEEMHLQQLFAACAQTEPSMRHLAAHSPPYPGADGFTEDAHSVTSSMQSSGMPSAMQQTAYGSTDGIQHGLVDYASSSADVDLDLDLPEIEADFREFGSEADSMSAVSSAVQSALQQQHDNTS